MGPAKVLGSRGQGEPTSTPLFLAPLPQGPSGDPKVRLVLGLDQLITVKVETDTTQRQDIPSHYKRKMPPSEEVEMMHFSSTDIRLRYTAQSPGMPSKAGPDLGVFPYSSCLGHAGGGQTRQGQNSQFESR